MARKLYIETVGCQMNVLDSELVVAVLRKEGYELTCSRREADTILLNTCSVREHAEEKVYSALGRLQHVKRQRPGPIIGVLGCMAQKDQQLVLRRAPHVDLVVGPGQLHRIGALVRAVESGAGQCVEVGLDELLAVVRRLPRAIRVSIPCVTRRCGRIAIRPLCGS